MNEGLLPFGPGAWVVIGLYVASLLVLGWIGYRARAEDSLRDFYLAGRGFGFLVLVLTLYATQYSGNTLLGFTGKTYRIGYAWVMSLHFMTAIIVFYLLFAPQLYRLARARGFITPTDYLNHRFRSPGLNVIASLVMVVALSNYLLAQLMALGRAMEGLSGADPFKAYLFGVIFLALIMGIYESMGGLRAVAWTDAIQGGILFTGFFVLLWLVFDHFGSLGESTARLLDADGLLQGADAAKAKALPPPAARCREWFSYILIVGIGGALYPQAIQRIYAARSGRSLRLSLGVMAFLPLTTTLVALIVGVTAAAHVPGLEGAASDRVLMVVCRQIQAGSLFGYWLVVILFAGVLAAIMSTADSALLSISSMLTKDIYAQFIKPSAGQAELTRLGKRTSWALLAVLVLLAILLRETTLMRLLDRKFDLLVQLAPGFILGIHWRGLRAGPTLAGLVVGLIIAVGLVVCGYSRLYDIHPGLWGVAANLIVAAGGSVLLGKRLENA